MATQQDANELEANEPEVITIAIGMLDTRALEKPAPIYPVLVDKIKLKGKTVVEVRIDQSGKVEHAAIISGHGILHQAVLKAAFQARFAPTYVQGQRVKLSGFLTYELG
ncbi:MAG TPA: energy transducer TonB [Blastocatellia bacterium]|nr:energy transducer TonB [Blastocatellia bacterium]